MACAQGKGTYAGACVEASGVSEGSCVWVNAALVGSCVVSFVPFEEVWGRAADTLPAAQVEAEKEEGQNQGPVEGSLEQA